MKVITYSQIKDGDNTNKENFINQFSIAPKVIRKSAYHTGLIPDELWKLFFKFPYPRPIDYWIITDEQEEVIGRIGASVSASYEKKVFVGFFEAKNKTVARELFKQVEEFSKANSCNSIIGPMNINTWFQYRLSTACVEDGDTVYPWEPVNPPEYNDFFKDSGFEINQTYTTNGIEGLTYKLDKYEASYQKATSNGYKIRHIDFDNDLENEIKRIYEISMEGFKDNLYFEPIPFELFRQLYVPAVKSYDFKYSTICESGSGEAVAFFFVFKQDNYMVLKSVATKINHRRQGISNALTLISLNKAKEDNLENTITALVKDEAVSEAFSSGGDFLWSHKYNLYQKDL